MSCQRLNHDEALACIVGLALTLSPSLSLNRGSPPNHTPSLLTLNPTLNRGRRPRPNPSTDTRPNPVLTTSSRILRQPRLVLHPSSAWYIPPPHVCSRLVLHPKPKRYIARGMVLKDGAQTILPTTDAVTVQSYKRNMTILRA